jgi:carbonic anhydrase
LGLQRTSETEVFMSAIDDVLRANAAYARGFDRGNLPTPPRLKLAILTCMDSRILPSRAFGVEEGDAHIIRNSGGRAREALRSLVISQQLLGTREIAVIHHTECGSLTFSNQELHERLRRDLGADASAIDFLPFRNLEESVREDVSFLISSPLIAPDATVRGFIYDVRTGRLQEVEVDSAAGRKEAGEEILR